MAIIKREFYARNTLDVAKALLGQILCRRVGGEVRKGKIVEVEAYMQEDPACHAYRGKTPRAKTLFCKPGTSYVYFIYGMHHCVNIVTDRENYGSGVLIRALEPVQNIDNTNGPSRLCKALNITREQNETDVTALESDLWLEYGDDIESDDIVQTTRIGLKVGVDTPWRFYLKDNKWVSKK